jgi:hypothetical protein
MTTLWRAVIEDVGGDCGFDAERNRERMGDLPTRG